MDKVEILEDVSKNILKTPTLIGIRRAVLEYSSEKIYNFK